MKNGDLMGFNYEKLIPLNILNHPKCRECQEFSSLKQWKFRENDAELDFREPVQTNPTGATRLRSWSIFHVGQPAVASL
jgi:hypothetical protein